MSQCISDMFIYMLFEGRRFWPASIRTFLIQHQKGRLDRLREIFDNPPPKDDHDRYRRYLEVCVEYGYYPIDEQGVAEVAYPTRLGNLIESFETYPKIKYGLDGVFYWYRLWVVLDKDLREEIDNSQAVVDSAVYISFVFYVTAIVMLIYAGIKASSQLHLPYLCSLSAIELPYLPSVKVLCVIATTCVVMGFAVYRLSLPIHAQFGELFKSIFDQYRSKLVFNDVLKEVAVIVDDPSLMFKSQRDKNMAVWRYLRWHKVRDLAGKNFRVGEWQDRQKPSTPAGP